jgi:acetyltransferase-like isoleucine patch superfamily enzyme
MKGQREDLMDQRGNSSAVRLGEAAVIDAGVVLGYPSTRDNNHLLIIGPNARIRSGTVIYGGSCIGCDLETGHNVVIREQNLIGDNLHIWSNSTIDYGCKIGNNVKIHHNVYITQFTTVEDDAFLGPGVTLANDIHPGCPDAVECMRGPVIKRGAQIGINVCVLPRVIIGEYALIGAGSVVTKDIPPGAVAYGNPAQVRGRIENLVCTTGLRDKPYSHLIERLKDVYTLR